MSRRCSLCEVRRNSEQECACRLVYAVLLTPDMLLLGCSLIWIRGLFDVVIESLFRLFAIDGPRREMILEAWHRGKGGV